MKCSKCGADGIPDLKALRDHQKTNCPAMQQNETEPQETGKQEPTKEERIASLKVEAAKLGLIVSDQQAEPAPMALPESAGYYIIPWSRCPAEVRLLGKGKLVKLEVHAVPVTEGVRIEEIRYVR